MICIFDILKLIMSFFVAAVHINPLSSYSETLNFYLVNSLGRIPVPVFFTIAGYFLYKKIFSNPEICACFAKKYLKRIISVYVIWSFIYFIPYYMKNPSSTQILKFVPHLLLDGVYSQLWYMQALIIVVTLSVVLSNKIGINKTLIISLVLYTIGLILVPYLPILENILGNNNIVIIIADKLGKKIGRNGLMFGMFFFTFGGFIYNSKRKPDFEISTIGLILSTALLFIETTIIKKIGGHYLGLQLSLIPLTYFLINFSLCLERKLKHKIDTKNIRILSFLIYLVHEWIDFLYCKIIKNVQLPSLFNNSIISYTCILSITIIISYTIIFLSRKENFNFLKKIY